MADFSYDPRPVWAGETGSGLFRCPECGDLVIHCDCEL